MPRGLLGARSIAARFEAAKKEPEDKSGKDTEVGWTWHDEEGSRPVLLPSTLKGNFEDGALIRVKFAEKPELPFFIRANAEYYSDRLKTGNISITKSILNAAGVPGNEKRAKLEVVEEGAAALKRMVMVIGDIFLSKRDLWHMQLAMMQRRGRIIYCGYSQNFCEHVPRSHIEQLLGADGKPVFCGSVSMRTEVIFRSSSAHMFLLIEVSAELFQYGLMGLPYWQILLDCLGQCMERVCNASSKKMSHYIRLLLFARRKPTVGTTPGDGTCRAPTATRKEFTAYGPPEDHQDFYDVIFEGYASAMPSPQELRSRVSRIFLTLLEEEEKYKKDPTAWVEQQKGAKPSEMGPWQRMRAGELVESEEGNLLECLNLALNHFDQHHLDRDLKVSGQVVVIMTAGCGLIRTRTKELYLLTNRRCLAAGHTSFQLVGVKDPPWHRVPWVQWPGGPTLHDLVLPSQPIEWEGDKRLSPFPAWLSYIPYQEAVFCPCLDNKDWVKAGFLPLLDSAPAVASTPIPRWTNSICSLEEQPKRARQEMPELSPKSMPSFPDTGPALRSFRISSNQKTWDEIRLPRLRAHLSKSKKSYHCYAPVAYSVNPQRFGNTEGAKLELMYDLVGLRLAALGGTQIAWHDGVAGDQEAGKPEQMQPWQVYANLLPTSLHDLTVLAACGSEWRFKPQATDLTVSRTERFKYDRDKATSFLYEQFFVHLTSTWKRSQWIESRCVFHLQERLDWNFLDHVLAGVYQIPPALPYPVDRSQLHDDLMVPRRDSSTTSFAGDTRDGWQLRGALKQHMLILMPKSSLASSHWEMMRCVLARLGGQITIGKDPFDAFSEIGAFEKNQEMLLEALLERQARVIETASDCTSLPSRGTSRNGFPDKRPQALSEDTVVLNFEVKEVDLGVTRAVSGPNEEVSSEIQDEVSPSADAQQLLEDFANVRKCTVQQFESFQTGLKKLCFGRLPLQQFEKESMGIDTSMKHFTVGRAEKTVSVRGAELETSFLQSRDWFGAFYDDVYGPPKFFHIVLEWIACSACHMTSFLTNLDKLAARHGFRLLRLPIGILFPQPAPAWVWSSDQETNFDRLPFYPRKRMSLPTLALPREQVYARLLQAWVKPPLKFHFIFASPIQDFKAYPIVAEEDAKEKTSAKKEVYQRLKGWVLCDPDGFCLATLREECIYFFENPLHIFHSRTQERVKDNLRKAERVHQLFFHITTDLLESMSQEKPA